MENNSWVEKNVLVIITNSLRKFVEEVSRKAEKRGVNKGQVRTPCFPFPRFSILIPVNFCESDSNF